MKHVWLFLFLPACAASVAERDVSTNFSQAVYQTRIDFQPLAPGERDLQWAVEDKFFERNSAPLREKLDAVAGERDALYAQLAEIFPHCQRERHCLASVVRAGADRLEKAVAARRELLVLDGRGVELEAEIKLLERRRELRRRAIFNRYLVHELLQVSKAGGDIQSVTAHSLEAFPLRRPLLERLAWMAEPTGGPALYGDLQFRMMSQAVDEAAVLATFDVQLAPGRVPAGVASRMLVTFLVNAHQLDPHRYTAGFQRAWAQRFGASSRRQLVEGVFCNLYAIAGETLAARMGAAKAKTCAPQRIQQQARGSAVFQQRQDPGYWILPIAIAPIGVDR